MASHAPSDAAPANTLPQLCLRRKPTRRCPLAKRGIPHGLPQVAAVSSGDGPLANAFPPDGARVDPGGEAVGLKVNGGTPPFTWLADGVPVMANVFRRDAFWEQPGKGFARLSVVDAKGRTASAHIRIE